MSAYSDYLSQLRRLLHDSNDQFWSASEKLDYINQGRNRCVRDAGAYRLLQTRNLVASTETYSLSTGFSTSNDVFDVVNLTIRWGNSRIVLRYFPWSLFNARYRYWQSYVGRPIAFSVYAYNQVYVFPQPDQTYTGEWDTVCKPPAIVDASTAEVIPYPFIDCPQYYAAALAKRKEQSHGEADKFEALYNSEVSKAINSSFTRRLSNPYSR